jgi:hypothetical protein
VSHLGRKKLVVMETIAIFELNVVELLESLGCAHSFCFDEKKTF